MSQKREQFYEVVESVMSCSLDESRYRERKVKKIMSDLHSDVERQFTSLRGRLDRRINQSREALHDILRQPCDGARKTPTKYGKVAVTFDISCPVDKAQQAVEEFDKIVYESGLDTCFCILMLPQEEDLFCVGKLGILNPNFPEPVDTPVSGEIITISKPVQGHIMCTHEFRDMIRGMHMNRPPKNNRTVGELIYRNVPSKMTEATCLRLCKMRYDDEATPPSPQLEEPIFSPGAGASFL